MLNTQTHAESDRQMGIQANERQRKKHITRQSSECELLRYRRKQSRQAHILLAIRTRLNVQDRLDWIPAHGAEEENVPQIQLRSSHPHHKQVHEQLAALALQQTKRCLQKDTLIHEQLKRESHFALLCVEASEVRFACVRSQQSLCPTDMSQHS